MIKLQYFVVICQRFKLPKNSAAKITHEQTHEELINKMSIDDSELRGGESMGLELICTLLVLRVGQRLVGNLKKASHQGTRKVIYPFTVVTTVGFLMLPPTPQEAENYIFLKYKSSLQRGFRVLISEK